MAEAGVNLNVGRGLTVTPRASLGYSSFELSGFRENGGEVALQLNDLRLQRLEAKMGAKFAGSASIGGGWNFVPQLQADWVQNLSGTNDGMTVRFANAPGYAFALPLANGDSSWAEVKGGMKLTNGVFEFGAGVESSLGRSSYKDDRAVADFTWRF
jgi:outer membrane autotransporter protein